MMKIVFLKKVNTGSIELLFFLSFNIYLHTLNIFLYVILFFLWTSAKGGGCCQTQSSTKAYVCTFSTTAYVRTVNTSKYTKKQGSFRIPHNPINRQYELTVYIYYRSLQHHLVSGRQVMNAIYFTKLNKKHLFFLRAEYWTWGRPAVRSAKQNSQPHDTATSQIETEIINTTIITSTLVIIAFGISIQLQGMCGNLLT